MRLVLLLHMHQPLYLDPISGRILLPWVRLHAIHGYHDVLSLVVNEGLKLTLNITPSLFRQLEMYAAGARDLYEDLSVKPPADLTPAERASIVTNFFSCHPDTMIQPYPRYWELFKKRGKRITPGDGQEQALSFTKEDLLDLQVWFNLVWFGFTALEADTNLRALLSKGAHFSEEDKTYVLNRQREVLKETYELHFRARDIAEFSTSPLHHPVLPLLLDTGYARRCMATLPLPSGGFAFPDDAAAQIAQGLRFMEDRIQRPIGMWPSEGSMCPEIIPVLAENGVRWAMTDQALLDAEGNHFSPWNVQVGNGRITVFFRDRALSDAIGFDYHKMGDREAVADFDRRLGAAQAWGARVVSIALDGENPWEYYPAHAGLFLRRWAQFLKTGERFRLVTPREILADPQGDVREPARVRTGSWIDGKFGMWIGQSEKNRAWELLAKARRFLGRVTVPPEVREKALQHMYAAEGSDWFWWYGDSFHSDQANTFDLLFRNNLIGVYTALGSEPPPFLLDRVRVMEESQSPVGFIAPRIDGRVSGYAEWYAAGSYECQKDPGRLSAGVGYLSRIYYGFDPQHLYLRLDPVDPEQPMEDLHVHLVFGLNDYKVLPLEGALLSRNPEGGFTSIGPVQAARDRVIEMAIPMEPLKAPQGTRIFFVVEVRRKGHMEDRYPRMGFLSVDVPAADFEERMWSA